MSNSVEVTFSPDPHLTVYEQDLHMAGVMKRAGIPMYGFLASQGVKFGTLTTSRSVSSDEMVIRWKPESTWPEGAKKPGFFETRYQIHQFETLDRVWYQVKEWKWYWPFWGFWSFRCEGFICNVEFETPERARQAIEGRRNHKNPVKSTLIADHH